MGKILITTSSFDLEAPEIKALEKTGYEVVLNPYKRRLSEEEVSGLLTPDITGMIAGVEPLTRKVIEGAQGLKVISRCGTGMDNVDHEAAQERGVALCNTPDAPAKAVAELTVGLIFSLLRTIPVQDRSIRAGEWERPMGRLLSEQAVGLVGFGRIGKLVAGHLKAFGCEILFYDPFVQQSDLGESLPLDVLLARSDIISLHMPANEQTRNMVDAAFLQKMKKGSYFVNTARGELVDEEALASAVLNGQLAGAALDVYKEEPYNGPLAQLSNVVLSAHTGSYAKETRAQQEAEAARNLLEALNGFDEKRERAHG